MNTTAELVARFRDITNLPEVDEGNPTPLIEHFLSEAQRYWFQQFSVHCPQILWANEVMTTTDGKVYSTSQDILGGLELYTGNGKIPLRSGAPWDYSADYTREGPRSIRVIGEGRTFPGGVIARYVPDPGTMNATTGPSLQPVSARILIVYHAAYLWASRGGERDPNPYLMMEERAAWGDPRIPGATGIITQLKQQTGLYGGVGDEDGVMWWRSRDFG